VPKVRNEGDAARPGEPLRRPDSQAPLPANPDGSSRVVRGSIRELPHL